MGCCTMQKIRSNIGLGGNIRALRKAAHLTQDQVVARLQLEGLDITRSIYSQIECGTYHLRVCELVALKKLFGTDYNAFFERLEQP